MKAGIITLLADHTESCHLALESGEKNFDIRLIYLGHLAMCARFFKALHLDQKEELRRILKIESNSYRMATPQTPEGASMRATWDPLAESLRAYLGNN